MRVLITGGAGFVGRHFTKRLVDDGNNVLIVDDLSSGLSTEHWAYPPKNYWLDNKLAGCWQHCVGDVRKWFWYENAQSKVAQPYDYDLIIHCAAIVGGRLNIDGDPLQVATDLAIDSDFFRWAVQRPAGVLSPKIIYFSSSAVYPLELQTEKVNCHLSEPLVTFDKLRIGRPDQTYGWSKLTGEYLAKIAAEQYGLDVKIYRPFGGYGEDQDFSYPFPSIIRRVLQKQNPIVVWGSGNQVRDFIHIDDVVQCVLSTYDKMKPGEVLNIGTGRGTSFRELAEMACNILGHRAEIASDLNKPQGVFHRVADSYKMDQLFEPKITLEEGIRRVAEHLQKALDAEHKAV